MPRRHSGRGTRASGRLLRRRPSHETRGTTNADESEPTPGTTPADVRGRIAVGAAQTLVWVARGLSVPSLLYVLLTWTLVLVGAIAGAFAASAVRSTALGVVTAAVVLVDTLVRVLFLVRRHRLLSAWSDPHALSAEIVRAVDVMRAWQHVRDVFEPVMEDSRPSLRRIVGVIGPISTWWRATQLTDTLLDDLRALPGFRYLLQPTYGTTILLVVLVAVVSLIDAVLAVAAFVMLIVGLVS